MKFITLEIKFTKLYMMSTMVKLISKFLAIVTYRHGIILSDILVEVLESKNLLGLETVRHSDVFKMGLLSSLKYKRTST